MRRLARLIVRSYRSPRARSAIGLVCLALMLIAVNILAARFLPERLDLTEDRLYTLSPATRQTLARIDEPITLRFYYSARLGAVLPSYRRYSRRVRRLLDQYVAAAYGKLRLEVYDPLPFSAVADRAVAFGLPAMPLGAQGDRVYFGLAGTNSTDDLEVIRFFAPDREPLLQYDLTRLIHALVVPKRTVVGLIGALPLLGNGRPIAMLRQLRQLDEFVALPRRLAAIPAGTDLLMIVHPHDLPQGTRFAIDQFVLRGGKAIVFVDPHSEMASRAGQPPRSDLPRLFHAWGLRLLPEAVAADRSAGGDGTPVDDRTRLDLKDGELNRQDPMTAHLRHVAVASAGILEPRRDAATGFEPLITTNRGDVIAARVTGPAETAFPDGPPEPVGKAGAPAAPVLRRAVRPIDVVAVADTDMLDGRLWAQTEDSLGQPVVVPLADNADFVANAIDVLSGAPDLVGLRSRGAAARPLDAVRRLQRAADRRYAAERLALERQLTKAEATLRDLTSGSAAAVTAPLSPADAKAIDRLRAEALATRRRLRAAEAARHTVRRRELVVEFVDIALMPLLVAAAALALMEVRARRRRRRAVMA